MAEKISVGKKKKVIAGALAGAVVLTGAGVGLGVGLGVGAGDPGKRIEFIVEEETGIDTVYTVEGEAVKVEELKVGDVIQFPTPTQTFIGQGDAKQYFVGWAETREAALPLHFVGEETITITENTSSLFAVYMTASEELVYTEVDESTCTVAYSDVAVDTERGGILVIPNEHEGKRVVAVNGGKTIADALAVIAQQQAIVEDSSKTKDEKDAAKAEITAQQTIITNALAAMQNKGSIKKVLVARGIERVDEYAFYGCAEMTSISFVDETFVVESGVEGQAVTIEEENVITAIKSNAFQNCSKLTNITIPAGVEAIGNSAFKNCSALASVVIEENSKLESIAQGAFNSSGVQKIDMTGCQHLTAIGHDAFASCSELKEVGLPDNTYAEFGGEMFYGSKKLERVSTDLSDPENYDMPEHISSTADSWFRSCEALKKVVLPKDITMFYCKMFENCKELTSVEFREGTVLSKNTGAYVESAPGTTAYYTFEYFTNCEKLESLVLPEGFEAIGVYSFKNCKSLKSIKFLATNVDFMSAATGNVSQIFYGCENLERVEFVEGATVRLTAYVGEGWRATYNTAANHGYLFAGCSILKYVGIANAQGVIEENQLPGFTGNMYDYMFAGTAIENFTLPVNATTTGNFAFLGCLNLKSIEIPAAITKIGMRSFEATGLEHIVIPENVTEIGYRAFQQIATLKSITFNCKNLTTVGGDAFQPYYTGEPFEDADGNGKWDEGETYTDVDKSGSYTMQQPVESQLTKITFGANVTNINFSNGIWSNAVASHKNITTIEFLGEVPTITNMPEFASVTTVKVPAGKLDAYKTAFAFYADKMVEASA